MLFGIFTLIIDAIAGVLAGVLLLRFWMQAVRVRPPISVAQFTFQLSDWLVKPLRRIIPGIGGYDWASLIGAFLIVALATAIKLEILGFISVEAVLIQSLLRLFLWCLYGLTGLIVLEVIFSWINPHAPLAPFVGALNDPLLRPFRRVIPLVGGIDFSSFVVLILLQIGMQLIGRLMLLGI
ncbi:MAG: YggT family protein [Burkholderiales bacterium]|nr:YggT family protein [Burkholderiales bacterium]